MASSGPVTTLVIYRSKAGAEQALGALVQKHIPVLRGLGLLGPGQTLAFRAEDKLLHAVSFVGRCSSGTTSVPPRSPTRRPR